MLRIRYSLIAAAFMVLTFPAAVRADSWAINYQAYLTDTNGSPVDSTANITFDAYNVGVGGSPLWTQSQTVDANQGLINVTLGNPINPFPASLFDASIFIEITVNGETLEPRRPLLSSAFSFKAANADLLSGLPAASFDQSADVQNLQNDVTDQETRISSLEASPADITSVIAGGGLSGGATTGSATLSIAAGGVRSSHLAQDAVTNNAIRLGAVTSSEISDGAISTVDLAADSVDGSKIVNGTISSADIALFGINGSDLAPFTVTSFQLAGGAVTGEKIASNAVSSNKITDNTVASVDLADGTIEPIDLNADASYSMGGILVDGETTLSGPVTIEVGIGSGDIVIADDTAKMRWFNSDQSQEKASIEVGSSVSFNDIDRNRALVFSNGSGIGIGTTAVSTNTDITMTSTTIDGDTVVNGALGIGYVVINEPLVASTVITSCGDLNCRTWSATASCPPGFVPTGGGFSGPVFISGEGSAYAVLDSYRRDDVSAWQCRLKNWEGVNDMNFCQAICLRLNPQ